MSRSKKIGIIKDSPRNYKKSSNYWRKVRRVINQKVKNISKPDDIILNVVFEDSENLLNGELLLKTKEEQIPVPKEIINDYDYSDYHYHKTYNKIPK